MNKYKCIKELKEMRERRISLLFTIFEKYAPKIQEAIPKCPQEEKTKKLLMSFRNSSTEIFKNTLDAIYEEIKEDVKNVYAQTKDNYSNDIASIAYILNEKIIKQCKSENRNISEIYEAIDSWSNAFANDVDSGIINVLEDMEIASIKAYQNGKTNYHICLESAKPLKKYYDLSQNIVIDKISKLSTNLNVIINRVS